VAAAEALRGSRVCVRSAQIACAWRPPVVTAVTSRSDMMHSERYAAEAQSKPKRRFRNCEEEIMFASALTYLLIISGAITAVLVVLVITGIPWTREKTMRFI